MAIMEFQQFYTWSKTFALVWFFVIFVALVVWIYWPGKKNKYDEAARRILDDD